MTQTRSALTAICSVYISVFFSFFAFTTAIASAPSLEWDPNPDPYVAGYNVYFGEKSRTYRRVIDVGLQTSVPLTNLNPGVTYFIAVTAYDTNRLESPFSDEVSYTPRVDGSNAVFVPFTLAMRPGAAALQFSSGEGQICRVVASSDLVEWEEVYSVTLVGGIPAEYLDLDPESRPRRFYRVIATPATEL